MSGIMSLKISLKGSKAGLFQSFSLTVCVTKTKEPSLSYNLLLTGWTDIHAFLKSINAKWNTHTHT